MSGSKVSTVNLKNNDLKIKDIVAVFQSLYLLGLWGTEINCCKVRSYLK